MFARDCPSERVSVTGAPGALGRLRSLADFYVTSCGRRSRRSSYRAATTGTSRDGRRARIYLVVWSTIAEQSGGMSAGSRGRVRGPLHRLDPRRTMNVVFTRTDGSGASARGSSPVSSYARCINPLRHRGIRGRKIPWVVYYLPIARPDARVPPTSTCGCRVLVFAIAIWART